MKDELLTNFIPINRQLFEHHLWCEERDFSRFEAWLYLLKEARFEDTKLLDRGKLVLIKRGQVYASMRFLATAFGWSKKRVETFLKLLVSDAMIKTETAKETGQGIITICNYDKYNIEKQIRKTHKETPRGQQGDTAGTKSNKENNNTSNSDELLCETSQPHAEHIDYKSLIDFFNSQTKGIFGTVQHNISEKRKGLIRARIREHGKAMFVTAIEKACKSDYLKSGKFNCTFDWMIRPTNFEKIISGNYDNKDRNHHSESGIGDELTRNILEGLARAEFEKQQQQ